MPVSAISFPAAFEQRMHRALGEGWSAFAKAHVSSPPISIRANPHKKFNTQEHTQIPWTSYGRYLDERPVFTMDPCFHAGAYYVQEASSMFLEQAFRQCADVHKPINVLDLCAAPGGKSTHLLSLLNSQSLLVSNEVIRSRTSILNENLQKWGYPNVMVTSNDPGDFQRLPGFFDVIVIDAPCSGEGLFRKDPGTMSEWSEENIAICCHRQRRILKNAWPSLKKNGILIYSTCTYNSLENEENLEWLAREHNAVFLSLKTEPEWGIETIQRNDITGYRFYPHLVKGEGFFLAVAQKTDSPETSLPKSSKNVLPEPSVKIQHELISWLTDPEDFFLSDRKNTIQFFPKQKKEDVNLVVQNLNVITGGTLLATVKHDKFVPEHGMALSVRLNKHLFPQLELSLTEAKQYLRKETLNIEASRKGFNLVTYQDIPLGWVNVLTNRINNLYPAAWRIRMSS